MEVINKISKTIYAQIIIVLVTIAYIIKITPVIYNFSVILPLNLSDISLQMYPSSMLTYLSSNVGYILINPLIKYVLITTSVVLLFVLLKQLSNRIKSYISWIYMFIASVLYSVSVQDIFISGLLIHIILLGTTILVSLVYNSITRITIVYIFSVLLYLICGEYSIVFLIITALSDEKNKKFYIVVVLLYLVSIIILSRVIYFISIEHIFLPVLTKGNFKIINVILIFSLPLIYFFFSIFKNENFKTITSLVLLITLFIIPVNDSQYLKVKYRYENNQFNEILNSELNPTSRFENFYINMSLLEKGIILDEMFKYPQKFGVESFFTERHDDKRCLEPASDIYFRLGFLNASLHWAHEGIASMGERISFNKYLAWNYFLLSEEKKFSKYTNKINSFFIDNNFKNLPSGYEKLQEFNPKSGFFESRKTPELILNYLLEENPENKTAFEVLTACNLLNKDIESVSINTKYLKKLKYKSIPVYIQQSILLFFAKNKIYDPKLMLLVSDDIKKQFDKLYVIIQKHDNKMKWAKSAIKREFGDTYWYFYYYGNS